MSPRERKKKRRPSWLEVAVARGGVRKGSDTMAFAMCWAVTEQKLGRAPTVEEYAVEWKVSSRTVFRELATFRDVWPEFNDPSGLLDAMRRSGAEYFSALLPAPKGVADG